MLFLPSKPFAHSPHARGLSGGGKWGKGLVLRPSVNQDWYFQCIKHRMQLFTEGFTANPVSLNQREKKMHVNIKTLVTCVIPTIVCVTA